MYDYSQLFDILCLMMAILGLVVIGLGWVFFTSISVIIMDMYDNFVVWYKERFGGDNNEDRH